MALFASITAYEDDHRRDAPLRTGDVAAMSWTPEQQQIVNDLKSGSYRDDIVAEADMVMKGGITSGVVYPLAVCRLARQYKFRNLGGTSAGGIAAAFAAAAESNRMDGGFRELAALPELLGRDLPDLFQPSSGTRPLFAILIAAIDRTHSGAGKAAGVVGAFVRSARGWFTGAFAAVLVLGFGALILARGAPVTAHDWRALARGVPLLVILALPLALVAAAAGVALLALHELPRNGYGLCRGSTGAQWPKDEPSSGVEPFTDWMHARLNKTAGKDRGHVLTFGDLWGAEKDTYEAEAKRKRDAQPGDIMRGLKPAVRLEMMTTNLTLCRPTRLPFTDRKLLFCEEELRPYLPRPALEHLVASAYVCKDDDHGSCPNHKATPLRHLPDPPEFPVALAVRMTLSFPGLISAVPLYVIDHTPTSSDDAEVDSSPAEAEARGAVRCWFSDGGISSNFPIHFFDALWPRRPTFGISLGPYHDAFPNSHVYLPGGNRPVQPRFRPTETLGQFASALLDTLQNWSDEGQATLPGYRDRIVTVHHRENEGGMNLTMDPDTIEALAWRGYLAGAELATKFDFPRHRWMRYLTAMAGLDDVVQSMRDRFREPLPNGTAGYRDFVESEVTPKLGYKRSPTWRRGAVARTERLLAFLRVTTAKPAEPDLTADRPRPVPDLRITAHF
jgi:predicted acylesterase/phospholipase RssA